MKVSKELDSYIMSLIRVYAENGVLEVYELPEIELSMFAGMLLSDPDLAAESCGPDNKEFYSSMVPSLITFMKEQKLETMTDFVANWEEGIKRYFIPTMRKLIQERLNYYLDPIA